MNVNLTYPIPIVLNVTLTQPTQPMDWYALSNIILAACLVGVTAYYAYQNKRQADTTTKVYRNNRLEQKLANLKNEWTHLISPLSLISEDGPFFSIEVFSTQVRYRDKRVYADARREWDNIIMNRYLSQSVPFTDALNK